MGVIYIMGNFPFFWKVKIGITTFGKIKKRRKSVSRTTKGYVFPIFFSILPFGVRSLEQDLHKLFKVAHMPFKKGSGRTEWFFILVLFPAVLFILIETFARWCPLIFLILYLI